MPITNFPFTAIEGQPTFKLALILAAINPSIGGVLVSGPRGSAKSTLARALADVMRSADETLSPPNHLPFVTLPLGATEEMLVGTLNLQQVLNEQTLAFQEGLLAKANKGILYVDEVNLLQDNLVDLLLDVAASGRNVIERDGISHQHDANFLLMGTMNPDEGELRPQLQDRFGLLVELNHQYSVSERVAIVRLREAYDNGPAGFIAQYQTQQQALSLHIRRAKDILTSIECSDALRLLIAQRCDQACVDGLRADIVWYRAALAHAAWRLSAEPKQSELLNSLSLSDKSYQVCEQDVLQVEELVLAHRRQARASANTPPSGSPPPDSSPPKTPPSDSSGGKSHTPSPLSPSTSSSNGSFSRPPERENSGTANHSDDSADEPTAEGDWGSMPPPSPQESTQNSLQASIDVSLAASSRSSNVSARRAGDNTSHLAPWDVAGKTSAASTQGRRGVNNSKAVDWFASMVSTVTRNMGQWPLSPSCGEGGQLQLRYRKAKMGQPVLHLLLLDTSASILQEELLPHAISAIMAIAKKAYVKREHITIVGFGNQQVNTLLAQQKAPKHLRRYLENITAAGGTPLREVLDEALRIQTDTYRQQPLTTIRTYLMTDGRTTQSFDDKHLLGDVFVIDTEKAAVKRGKAKQIANTLGADYFLLPA